MGRDNGPLKERSLDFSVQHVLRCYADGSFDVNPRFLMIAVETDPIESEHLAYDFEFPAGDDARVVRREAGDDQPDWSIGHETFRERFLEAAFLQHAVITKVQQLHFSIVTSEGGSVPDLLDPLLRSLGFTSPCETGRYLRVYETATRSLLTRALLNNTGPRTMAARMGVDSIEDARSLLGQIAAQRGLECVDVDWIPKL
jgi:hypothetical protein